VGEGWDGVRYKKREDQVVSWVRNEISLSLEFIHFMITLHVNSLHISLLHFASIQFITY
jgi:hypothetical protein